MPPNEAKLNVSLLRKHLIKKLFKHIQKHDKVTVVGMCYCHLLDLKHKKD